MKKKSPFSTLHSPLILYLCAVINSKNKHSMATPIRMAPVLVGKEAEEFIERWQQSLKEPLKKPPTKEGLERYKVFMAKQKL